MNGPRGGGGAGEERLDALREEARREGRVAGAGVRAAGGPIPPQDGEPPGGDAGAPARRPAAGYYGRPVVKPPVWTWEVPLYFFVGGLAGMAAVLALGAAIADPDAALEPAAPMAALVRTALRIAAAGAVVSSALLVLDLGRPRRFLHMLRVFKWRSPMSVGAWTLAAFGAAAGAAIVLVELLSRTAPGSAAVPALEAAALAAIAAAGLLGAPLATYTGVLIGATAIPAWLVHHRGLPLHFGAAGLGSAAALLELAGFRFPALNALGLLAALVETALGAWIELRPNGSVDRALRCGRPALLLRSAALLSGPVALAARILGFVPGAAAAFLAGALLSRYGWLEAGRASALDPAAALTIAGASARPTRPARSRRARAEDRTPRRRR